MASIKLIKASDGTGNASVATVQTTRSSGATTILVDTVDNIPDHFMATMGTPHTFTDPVTGETITVISEATAVDFAGHVSGTNLEIDTIAPGQTDAGSAVGDIVVIKPTTQWADNVADVLDVEHNDDGTHGDITAGTVTADSFVQTGVGASSGWTVGLATPNTVTYKGNRSYSLVVNSTDLTGTISPGMRLRLTRTVSAPTQCTSLNGTTQYYSKTSPAGMTFTDDFVVSAWVKLSAYGASKQVVAGRYNGTSGYTLSVLTTGQIEMVGFNAGAGNYSLVQSYQSIPLNKWVHVAAQLDMSTFTATTTTSYVMIDGVDVPASVVRAGTNPTALVQAGNLEIGSTNGGTLPFNGKIAQVAIYSAKVTEATILASMNQGLAGTETNLISAYSFNNTINDLNANANNLTAQGSATATNADSPFSVNSFGTATGTTDYGIVTSATFSTNTTLVVQVPEANTIPTSGGVSAVSYSVQKVPYGFPAQTGKWEIECLILNSVSTSGTTLNTVYNPGGITLLRPVGDWGVYGILGWQVALSVGTTVDVYAGLSTSSSVFIQGQVSASTREYTAGYGSSPLRIFTQNYYFPSSGTVTANIYPLITYAIGTASALQLRGLVAGATNYEYSRIWAVPSNL